MRKQISTGTLFSADDNRRFYLNNRGLGGADYGMLTVLFNEIRFGKTPPAAYLCPLKKLYNKYGKIRAAFKIKEL